jgi:hypothetical protein
LQVLVISAQSFCVFGRLQPFPSSVECGGGRSLPRSKIDKNLCVTAKFTYAWKLSGTEALFDKLMVSQLFLKYLRLFIEPKGSQGPSTRTYPQASWIHISLRLWLKWSHPFGFSYSNFIRFFYASSSSHPPLFNHPRNIWWRVQLWSLIP